jgi:mycothiol synthase
MKLHEIQQQPITSRPYQGMDDLMRIRYFLMDTYRLNRTFHNWLIRRLEGTRFYGMDPERAEKWEKKVRLWETEDGQLVGVAHVEGGGHGDAWLQVHPIYRHIEGQMLDWAEQNLAVPDKGKDNRPLLWLNVYEFDEIRQDMLTERGYEKDDRWGILRWRTMYDPIPDVALADGYKIRSLRPGEMDDCAGWAAVIGAVFAHANPSAEDIARFQMSPSYRHDLHLVAEAEDGSFAAFAGLTIDTMNQVAEFEPVGTHPDHRKKGLGKALMVEGLRRLKKMDVHTVYVGTGDMIPANKLYESIGFTEHHKSHTWRKWF